VCRSSELEKSFSWWNASAARGMAAFIALPSPNASRRRDTASIAGSGPPGSHADSATDARVPQRSLRPALRAAVSRLHCGSCSLRPGTKGHARDPRCPAQARPDRRKFVFEERRHRITRSLSDLNGTDPYIHWGDPDRLLVELSNALVRSSAEPPLPSLRKIHEVVRRATRVLKRDYGTLYAARPFKEVVLAATQTAEALR
jgi:hypothetical protein